MVINKKEIEKAKNIICLHCTEKYCCRGICKELNQHLVNKKIQNTNISYQNK